MPERFLFKFKCMASKLTFWKPGTTGPGSTLDRATEVEGNVIQSAPSNISSIQAQRERLPIFKHSEYAVLYQETHTQKSFKGKGYYIA